MSNAVVQRPDYSVAQSSIYQWVVGSSGNLTGEFEVVHWTSQHLKLKHPANPALQKSPASQRPSPYLGELMAVWGRIRLLVLNQRESIEVLPTPGRSRRLLPLLVFLFAGSGCAALIYEIVWFQLLQLVIGSSGVSLGLLLAAYMGGLCAGSVLLPRFVPRRMDPLRVYAVLELGIGVLGLLVLLGVPIVARLYVEGVTEGFFGLVLRGIVAGACLLPPTLLMGGSLPAIARWLE